MPFCDSFGQPLEVAATLIFIWVPTQGPAIAVRHIRSRGDVGDAAAKGLVTSLYLPSFMLSLGLGIVSPILPVYAKSFEVSYAAASLVISLAGVGRLIADLPAGFLVDRAGARSVVLAAPLLAAIGGFGAGLAADFSTLLGFRFLMGVGMALWFVARSTIVAERVSYGKRGRVMSLFMTANLGGIAAGPFIGGLVADMWGMRSPFFFYGIVISLTFAVAYLTIGESYPNLDPHSNGSRGIGVSRDQLLNSSFLAFAFANFCNHLRFVGRSTLLPLFGGFVLGLSSSQIGILLGASTVINLALAPAAGAVMDRFGRKASLVPGLLVTGAAYLIFSYVGTLEQALIASVLLGIGSGLGTGTGATISADLSPSTGRSTFLALWQMIGDLATITGPIAMGVMADLYGLRSSFLMVGTLMFVASFVVQAKGRLDSESR